MDWCAVAVEHIMPRHSAVSHAAAATDVSLSCLQLTDVSPSFRLARSLEEQADSACYWLSFDEQICSASRPVRWLTGRAKMNNAVKTCGSSEENTAILCHAFQSSEAQRAHHGRVGGTSVHILPRRLRHRAPTSCSTTTPRAKMQRPLLRVLEKSTASVPSP